MSLFELKIVFKNSFGIQNFKLLYLYGKVKSSDLLKVMRKGFDVVNGIGFFLFKTWHLIVTEAPVQMALLFYRPMCA